LSVLLDAVRNSSFDPDELARELEVIQEEIRQGEDQPPRQLSQGLFETVFEVHAYGRPVIGTSESVSRFTRDDVLSFFRRWYTPDNMTLVAVGDVDEAMVRRVVDEFFSGSDRTTTARAARLQEPEQVNVRAWVAQRDVQEAHTSLGFRVPGLGHDDVAALELLTVILGQGESSRLFDAVQRRGRLATDVHAFLYTPSEPGLLLIGARFGDGDGTADVQRTIEGLLNVVRELRERPVTHAELERALRIVESDAIYQRQTVQGTAQRLGYFHTVAGGLHAETDFLERVRRLTARDLQTVAERYLRADALTVAVMLPESMEPPTNDELSIWAAEAMRAPTERPDSAHVDAFGVARVELANGLTLLVQRDDSAPTVSMRAVAFGGLLAEDESTAGASNIVATMLTSGTDRVDAAQLAQEVDGLAASVAGVSGRNTIGLRMTCLSRDFEHAVSIFADSLLNSTLPQDEIDRVKAEVLADIAASEDDAAGQTFRRYSEAMYAGHPYQRSVLGTRESVGGLSRAELMAFYRQTVHPSRIVLSVVGDIDIDSVVREIERTFRGDSNAALADVAPVQQPVISQPVWVEAERDRQQAHIVVGFPGVAMYDATEPEMDVLAAVLAGQGGRLFVELRDRQSLAYSVSAFNASGLGAGSFAFYIATSPDKVDIAIAGIRLEIQRVVDGGITEEELRGAQRYLVGRRDISMQRASARAGYLAFDELYGAGHGWGFGYGERVMEVTVESVHAAAQAVLDAQSEVVSLTRPGAEAEAAAPME
ncbi:MAG: zinc protease, partial [Flavobacteriales bacterium]